MEKALFQQMIDDEESNQQHGSDSASHRISEFMTHHYQHQQQQQSLHMMNPAAAAAMMIPPAWYPQMTQSTPSILYGSPNSTTLHSYHPNNSTIYNSQRTVTDSSNIPLSQGSSSLHYSQNQVYNRPQQTLTSTLQHHGLSSSTEQQTGISSSSSVSQVFPQTSNHSHNSSSQFTSTISSPEKDIKCTVVSPVVPISGNIPGLIKKSEKEENCSSPINFCENNVKLTKKIASKSIKRVNLIHKKSQNITVSKIFLLSY